MILTKKIITIISPLVLFGLLESIIFYNQYFWYAIASILLILGCSLKKMTENGDRKELIGFSLSPIALYMGGIAFLFLLEGDAFRHLLIAVITIVYALYIENLFKFYYQQAVYQPYSLENISMYSNILATFFILTTAFGTLIFLGFRVGQIAIPLFIFFIIVIIQTLWINKLGVKTKKMVTITITLIILEFFWVIHFLPTSHYVNALLLTTVFYIILNTSRLHLADALSSRSVKRHIIVCIIIFAIIMGTSRWV